MSRHPRTRQWRQSTRAIVLLLAFCLVLHAIPARAFPPYKSTDADTADPWTLEARLGLVQYQRERAEDAYSSPLLRLNLGLPDHIELLTETEYSHETDRIEEAAVGFKWIPRVDRVSVGVEALALLPAPGEEGRGIEAILLVTTRMDAAKLHLNAGGFQDERPDVPETGWKMGALLEIIRDGYTPGAELFAQQSESHDVEVSAGVGVIIPLNSFDFRTGARFGLTEPAPDVTASLWITGKFPLRDEGADD